MDSILHIPKSPSTPEIHFTIEGMCSIKGDSRPEFLDGLYTRVNDYIQGLIDRETPIFFTFEFNYYNTLAQRYVYELLTLLSTQKTFGTVVWIYASSDENVEEMGHTYKSLFPKLKIKLKEKP